MAAIVAVPFVEALAIAAQVPVMKKPSDPVLGLLVGLLSLVGYGLFRSLDMLWRRTPQLAAWLSLITCTILGLCFVIAAWRVTGMAMPIAASFFGAAYFLWRIRTYKPSLPYRLKRLSRNSSRYIDASKIHDPD